MGTVQKAQRQNRVAPPRVASPGLKQLMGIGMLLILVGLSGINLFLGLALALLVLLIVVVSPRPVWIVYALVLLLPLTGGLARGAAIPLLRVSQALVVVGFLLFVLSTAGPQGKIRLSIIDLAFMLYLLAGAVFPLLALSYQGDPIHLSATSVNYTASPIQTLLGPLQYYVLYRLVVGIISSEQQINVFLKLTFISSIAVSVIGILQKLNVGPVQTLINTYYPSPSFGYTIASVDQRITSTLQHYSGLGAYLSFTIILVLVCYAFKKETKISSLLLVSTLLFDSIALVLTGTLSAWIGLAIGGGGVLLLARRLPKIIIFILIGILIAVIVFSPFISARLNNELAAGAAQGFLPQSLALRIRIWQTISFPAISQHPFFGYGPNPLQNANVPVEDSEYIHLLLEGGALYLASYIGLMAAAVYACWRHIKKKSEGIARPIAIATLSILIALNVMNISGEYFTYVGGPQTIWMLLAVLVASWQIQALRTPTVRAGWYWQYRKGVPGCPLLSPPAPTPLSVMRSEYSSPYSLVPNYSDSTTPDRGSFGWLQRGSRWRRFLDWSFVRDSLIVGAGSTSARVLALFFMVILARFLTPADFGFFRYITTLVGILTIVSTSMPVSITRFLAVHEMDRQARDRYFTNGMVEVALITAATVIISFPILWLLHAFDIGAIVCILCLTAFYAYLAVMRGLNDAWKMGLTYSVSNLALLGALLVVFGLLKIETVTVALIIYGVTNLVPILFLEVFRPMALRFRPRFISTATLWQLARFALPLIVSSGAFTVWIGLDMLLIEDFDPRAVGSYAAAKTLSQAFIFIPAALAMILMPRVASQKATVSNRYVTGAVLITLLFSLMGCLLVFLFGHVIIALTFGHRYADAYLPLVILSLAMSIYSVYTILEGVVIGQGKPNIPVQALIIAVVSTGITGFWLTPRFGALGASLAFAIGATSCCSNILLKVWLSQRKIGRALEGEIHA